VIQSKRNKLSVIEQERMPTGYAGRETSHNSGPFDEKIEDVVQTPRHPCLGELVISLLEILDKTQFVLAINNSISAFN
jgi:hypothetical protein